MKRSILVLSEHTPDSSGGFLWWPNEEPARTAAITTAANAIVRPSFDHVTLLELNVSLKLTSEQITEYLDSILDVIETRQIGKIHGKRDRVPLERPTLGQTGVTS